MAYNFTAVQCKGATNNTPDVLLPSGMGTLSYRITSSDVQEYLETASQSSPGDSTHQGEPNLTSSYWPGIDNDIENMVAPCTECQDHLPSNYCKEPMVPS